MYLYIHRPVESTNLWSMDWLSCYPCHSEDFTAASVLYTTVMVQITLGTDPGYTDLALATRNSRNLTGVSYAAWIWKESGHMAGLTLSDNSDAYPVQICHLRTMA